MATSEVLQPPRNYARPPLVTAIIIPRSPSAQGVSERQGPFQFLFHSNAVCAYVGDEPSWRGMNKAPCSPADAPRPPTMPAAGPREQESSYSRGSGRHLTRSSEMRVALVTVSWSHLRYTEKAPGTAETRPSWKWRRRTLPRAAKVPRTSRPPPGLREKQKSLDTRFDSLLLFAGVGVLPFG